MKQGDTFNFTQQDHHLWIVLSDPTQDPDHVVIVNVTTWAPHKDGSCKLGPEDHGRINRPSCIDYGQAKDLCLGQLAMLENKGLLTKRTPLRPDVYQRVIDGAGASSRLAMGLGELLIEQGLIDD